MDVLESIVKHEIKFCVSRFVAGVSRIKRDAKFETDAMYMASVFEIKRRLIERDFDRIMHGVHSVIKVICLNFFDDINSVSSNCDKETNILYNNIRSKVLLLPSRILPNMNNLLPFIYSHLDLLRRNVKRELYYVEIGAMKALDHLCEKIEEFIKIKGLRTDEDFDYLDENIRRHISYLQDDMVNILESMEEKFTNNLNYLDDEIGRRKFVKFVSDAELDKLFQRMTRRKKRTSGLSPLMGKSVQQTVITSRRRRWRSAPGASRLHLQVVPLVKKRGTIIKQKSIEHMPLNFMVRLQQNKKEVPTSVGSYESGVIQQGLQNTTSPVHQRLDTNQHQDAASTSGIIKQPESLEVTVTVSSAAGRHQQEILTSDKGFTPGTSQQNNSQEIISMDRSVSETESPPQPEWRSNLTEKEVQVVSNFALNITSMDSSVSETQAPEQPERSNLTEEAPQLPKRMKLTEEEADVVPNFASNITSMDSSVSETLSQQPERSNLTEEEVQVVSNFASNITSMDSSVSETQSPQQPEISNLTEEAPQLPKRMTLTEEEEELVTDFALNIIVPEPEMEIIQSEPIIRGIIKTFQLIDVPVGTSPRSLQVITEMDFEENGSSNRSQQNDNQDRSSCSVSYYETDTSDSTPESG